MTSKDIKSFCLSLGLDAVGIAPAQLPAENVDAEICPLATGQGLSLIHISEPTRP